MQFIGLTSAAVHQLLAPFGALQYIIADESSMEAVVRMTNPGAHGYIVQQLHGALLLTGAIVYAELAV
jgi:hypothetical protein